MIPFTTLQRQRTADQTLARWLFQLRNQPEYVRWSGTGAPVAWEGHCQWLRERLASPKQFALFVAREGGAPLGFTRFEREEQVPSQATVSLVLEPHRTGQGLGGRMLRESIEAISSEWPELRRIQAFCHRENPRSIAFFTAQGFEPLPQQRSGGGRLLSFSRPVTATP